MADDRFLPCMWASGSKKSFCRKTTHKTRQRKERVRDKWKAASRKVLRSNGKRKTVTLKKTVKRVMEASKESCDKQQNIQIKGTCWLFQATHMFERFFSRVAIKTKWLKDFLISTSRTTVSDKTDENSCPLPPSQLLIRYKFFVLESDMDWKEDGDPNSLALFSKHMTSERGTTARNLGSMNPELTSRGKQIALDWITHESKETPFSLQNALYTGGYASALYCAMIHEAGIPYRFIQLHMNKIGDVRTYEAGGAQSRAARNIMQVKPESSTVTLQQREEFDSLMSGGGILLLNVCLSSLYPVVFFKDSTWLWLRLSRFMRDYKRRVRGIFVGIARNDTSRSGGHVLGLYPCLNNKMNMEDFLVCNTHDDKPCLYMSSVKKRPEWFNYRVEEFFIHTDGLL